MKNFRNRFVALLKIFITFFKIGLFTFGGGYAMLSLIESETVTKKGWLSGDELLNIIAISESTPGPISINCATYIGYKRAGFLGSVFATLGVVLPSFIIIFAISFFIDAFLKIDIVSKAFRGIQAAVAVLIVRAGFKMAKDFKRDTMSFLLLGLSLAITVVINLISFDFSTIYLIIYGGFVGFFVGLISGKYRRKKAQKSPDVIKREDATENNGTVNNAAENVQYVAENSATENAQHTTENNDSEVTK